MDGYVPEAHYFVNAFKPFLFLTSSEIQEDNVFIKKNYKEMGNPAISKENPLPKTFRAPIIRQTNIIQRVLSLAILKDYCEAARKPVRQLRKGLWISVYA